MIEITCPSCGSPKLDKLGNGRYQCPYCGNVFNAYGTDAQQESDQGSAPSRRTFVFVTIALIVAIVVDAIVILYCLCNFDWEILPLMGLCVMSLVGAILLFQLKKLGFFLFAIANAISTICFLAEDDSTSVFFTVFVAGSVIGSLFIPMKRVRYWDML